MFILLAFRMLTLFVIFLFLSFQRLPRCLVEQHKMLNQLFFLDVFAGSLNLFFSIIFRLQLYLGSLLLILGLLEANRAHTLKLFVTIHNFTFDATLHLYFLFFLLFVECLAHSDNRKVWKSSLYWFINWVRIFKDNAEEIWQLYMSIANSTRFQNNIAYSIKYFIH
jgi:hypothetical protein